jgi:hypothetical protein
MATWSETGDLNSLFASIYEGAYFVSRQGELLPRLVNMRTANTMAPRVLKKTTKTTTEKVNEGEAPTGVKLARTSVDTITPAIYHHQFALTDEMLMTDPDGARQDAVTEIGMGIKEAIEKDGALEFANFTAEVGAIDEPLTLGKIRAGLSVLQGNSPIGDIQVVLHPFEWDSILSELIAAGNHPISSNVLANEAMKQYFVGSWLGANWYLDNAINTAAVGKVAGAIFCRPAIVYDERTPLTLEVERNSSIRGWLVNGVVRAGWGTQKAEHGVKLLGEMATPTA